MNFAGVSYVAILVAGIAGFVFGSAWYGVLGKSWLAALGKTRDQLKGGLSMPVLMGLTFAAQLVMAWVLAGVIGHLGVGQVTVVNGLFSALFLWAGLVATTLLVNHRFQGATWSLTLIDGGHWLGVLVVQGLVIGLMGV